MKVKALILTGMAFLMTSAPMALAEKGGHKKGGGTGYIEVWVQGGWGYGSRYCDADSPWQYGRGAGLPPGLAKRDRLPPGLEKHLWKHGSLPPGLQKKVDSDGWRGGKKHRGEYDY